MSITASMLYNLSECEHRPWMDLHAEPALRDPVSPFVEMLWRRGRAHEDQVMSGGDVEVLNLRTVDLADRAAFTLEAMRNDTRLIYGGRLEVADLCGEPDLLRLIAPGRYMPGDIKSGSAEEAGPSDDEGKPKQSYAVQLALYVDALDRLGFGTGTRRGFIWDVHGLEVEYDLDAAKGVRTPSSFWDDYVAFAAAARATIGGQRTRPASSGKCSLCVWNTACHQELEDSDDLTLIAGLGRAMRGPLSAHVATISEFAASTPSAYLDAKGKSIVAKMSADSIRKFHARATLFSTNGAPYRLSELVFPSHDTELFFDIETDPGRKHCYLHGFIERSGKRSESERFFSFFTTAPTDEAEREAFAAAWAYVDSRRPCAIYIYSKYERTWWRSLQERFPNVCSAGDIEDMFDETHCIDLLQVVNRATEWPTRNRTIKTLARYLGFSWRDADPSGAASIEWYDRHLSGDESAKQRILDYNEDDCRATRVLLDGIQDLPLIALE